jgi:Icc-related predicted phosphoesterase
MNPTPAETDVVRIRMLTAADVHQSRRHYHGLESAVTKHRPDVVAFVGDALHALEHSGKFQFFTAECASLLASLPVDHLWFIRGNHEHSNWPDFVAAWPHKRRPLVAVYGAAQTCGPLAAVGFPCLVGSEFYWCAHLSATDNLMEPCPAQHRPELPADFEAWLPALMRTLGSSGRAIWLMHESPVGLPLVSPRVFNPLWTTAVERFSPLVVVCGHDHHTPIDHNIWHAWLGKTLCVNVGQTALDFHYALLDFEFAEAECSLPTRITIRAFPWDQEITIHPR